MNLDHIIMRKGDNETLTGFYTEIKFTVMKYLCYEYILCIKSLVVLKEIL